MRQEDLFKGQEDTVNSGQLAVVYGMDTLNPYRHFKEGVGTNEMKMCRSVRGGTKEGNVITNPCSELVSVCKVTKECQ